jgi:hypothetical protein
MENGCELNVELANPLAEAIRKPQERGATLPHRPRVKQKWDRNAASRHTALPKPVLLKPGGLAAPPVARLASQPWMRSLRSDLRAWCRPEVIYLSRRAS